jgi:caspase domain-containing protein
MNKLFQHVASLVGALLMAMLVTQASAAGRRVALIIGNATYEHADILTNTVNDADAIADVLKRAGFDVVDERKNVGVVEFKRAVREFMTAAANADIAVVYYSGHGIEVGGVNYLIPVDAKLASDYDVDDETISLERITLATQPAQKLRLIILDACRDNPFLRTAEHPAATRAIANRLMSVQPTGTDTLVAYAAKAGSVSYDGVGPNSPFTTALVKYIAEPGLDIRIALGRVRDDVLESTGHRQEPFVYGSLGGANISLVPAAAVAPAIKAPPLAADPNAVVALDYQMAERVGGRQGWEAFLSSHATGFYADLARAQLTKLTAAEPPKPTVADKDAAAQTERVASLQRLDQERGAPGEAAKVKLQQQAALQPQPDPSPTPVKLTPAPAPPSPPPAAPAPPPAASSQAEVCKADEARLTRLRADPSVEALTQLARELACEDLRPQVQRLMESLGGDPAAAAKPAQIAVAAPSPIAIKPVQAAPVPPAPTKVAALSPDQACKADEARLARLRADPSVEPLRQLARELACEDLRPQVQRLMESLGADPVVAVQSPAKNHAKGIGPSPDEGQRVALDPVQACQRDAQELSRLRANPDREATLRFTRDLQCEDLREQAARLLESVGD